MTESLSLLIAVTCAAIVVILFVGLLSLMQAASTADELMASHIRYLRYLHAKNSSQDQATQVQAPDEHRSVPSPDAPSAGPTQPADPVRG